MKVIPNNSIVATIGPASWDAPVFLALVESGLTVARVNMSHDTHARHAETIAMIRKVAPNVLILGDLCGPKIRTGEMKDGSIELKEGATCIVTSETVMGTPKKFSVAYPTFSQEVAPGMKIYLEDGKKVIQVQSIKGEEVTCKILVGGSLADKKGVNIPEAALTISSLTKKDLRDIDFLVEQKVDLMALSFVRSAANIKELKEILAEKNFNVPIVSKIETLQAMAKLDSVVKNSDLVMVARGDLGVEIGFEYIPQAQQKIITACKKHKKQVIVATQMIESMMHNETPTRAEVSDVANAIREGATAVMTSGETSLGKYPVKTIQMMKKIVDLYKVRKS